MLLLKVVKDLENLEKKLYDEGIYLQYNFEESYNYFRILKHLNMFFLPPFKVSETFPVLYERYVVFPIFPNKTETLEKIEFFKEELKIRYRDIKYSESFYYNKNILNFFECRKKGDLINNLELYRVVKDYLNLDKKTMLNNFFSYLPGELKGVVELSFPKYYLEKVKFNK